jgi:predicted RNase H-like nuclease (RuvC/YqgF family)
MTVITEIKQPASGLSSQVRVKMRMLEQMAEALEDQVAALYRRAAAFEEDEFLLNREVEERQTEINRLMLKLESMRGERDRVMEKIETVSCEAIAIREEIFSNEEEAAIAAIAAAPSVVGLVGDSQPVFDSVDSSCDAVFFRRMTLSEQAQLKAVQ